MKVFENQEAAYNAGYHEFLLDSGHGIHLPEVFAERFNLQEWGIDTLTDLDSNDENYWDTWDDILTNAEYLDSHGVLWRLYQDGDLFAYAVSDNGEPIEIQFDN